MDQEIGVKPNQPTTTVVSSSTTVDLPQPQEPDRSITKPGTLVTPESDHHEYKSLQQLINRKPEKKINWVSEICKKIGEDWEKEFNAMLNSKYGTVHFGIRDDCRVEEGVPLTEKDQDQIRMRVSQSFEKFYPAVIHHSPFSIYFIKMENGLFRFDVDIERKSSLDTVFMSRGNSIAYWRSGGRCALIPVDAIRNRDTAQINDMLKACIEAQVILQIRDATCRYHHMLTGDLHGKAVIDLLSPFVGMFNYKYDISVASEFVELLEVISSRVRHGLSEEAIKKVTDMAFSIYLVYQHELLETGSKTMLYLLTETFFNVAYDGILRKSIELFQYGAIPLSKLIPLKNQDVQHRYEGLKTTVISKLVDNDKTKWLNYLELLEEKSNIQASETMDYNRVYEIERRILFDLQMYY